MPRNHHVAIVTVTLLAVALAGCAQQAATQSDGESDDGTSDLASKVDRLEQEVQDLRSENRDLQQRVDRLQDELPPENGTDVRVVQEEGGLVYWVLPGPREMSRQVFGTPDDRRTTADWQIQAADGQVETFLEDFPFPVGVPEDADIAVENGTMVLQTPTLFGDEARVVDGSLDVTYRDRQPRDTMPPGNTTDRVALSTTFTDPDGHAYRIEIDHVIQPPFPGYATQGGVMVNAFHHGITGTGSPLMPRVHTYGASWAAVDLFVDGTMVDDDVVGHFMTTEVVRDADYELAIDEEVPLPPGDRAIPGRSHHTHGVVFPIHATPDGPVHAPVNTSFVLPNGDTQPFIHVMFEEDRIVEGPFTDPAPSDGDGEGDGGSADADFTVTAHDPSSNWHFAPGTINVTAGEEVTVAFVNDGRTQHNWGVDVDGDGELADDVRTETIPGGASTTVTFTAPDEPGEYAYWCDVTGHRQQGLVGTLNVTAA